ncbi:MAG: YerC/YecD family TrpR-related protein [Acholeplasmataceae bacterium]
MAYKSKFSNKEIDTLFEAILSLESIDDCYRFFEDVCTIKEIQDMSQRFEVAEMLFNKEPYQIITSKTKASTATISRVSKSLSYGADGYKLIFDKQKGK